MMRRRQFNKRKLALLPIILLATGFGTSTYYYLLPQPPVQVSGAFGTLGVVTHGSLSVDNATGKSFAFLSLSKLDSFNFTLPAGDSQVLSLSVLRPSLTGSAVLDRIAFNGSGKIGIRAANLSEAVYQIVGGSEYASVHFAAKSGMIFLPPSVNVGSEIPFIFKVNESQSIAIDLATTQAQFLFIQFGARNGRLDLVGTNYSLPIQHGYVGIQVRVAVPINRDYEGIIQGVLSQLSVQEWNSVGCSFPYSTSAGDQIQLAFPNGSLAYGSKTLDDLGSQDLKFHNLVGNLFLFRGSSPAALKVIVAGTAFPIDSISGSQRVALTDRPRLSILFPTEMVPWLSLYTVLSIVLAMALRRLDEPWITVFLAIVIVLLFGALGWSILGQQAPWVQNVIAYSAALVSVVALMIQLRRDERVGEVEGTSPSIREGATKYVTISPG